MLHAESLLLELPHGIKQEYSNHSSTENYSPDNQTNHFYGNPQSSILTEFGAKLIVPPQAQAVQSQSRSSSTGSGGSGGSSRRKSYPCDICPAMFGSKMELEEHSNSHTGEKPFECDVCNARFNRRSTLWNHKRIHSDQKPFRCPICSMHFKWKNSLKCHKEMHLRKNETGPMDAEEFRLQLLSPSKRGRTARGGSRKRGGSATAAASSVSVSPLATNGRGSSPDFSMLEDPTGYSAANLLAAAQEGGLSNGQAHYDQPMMTQRHDMPRGTSILQQALQQPVSPSPALSLAVHQGQPQPPQMHQQQANGGASYQIYVHSLPQQETKPNGGLLQTVTSTHYQPQGPPPTKLSPPTGTTPLQNSRGESPIASGGQVPRQGPPQQTQHLIQYLTSTSSSNADDNNNRQPATTTMAPLPATTAPHLLPPVSFYSQQNLGDMRVQNPMPPHMDTFTSSLLATSTSGPPPAGDDYMPNMDFVMPANYGQFTSHSGPEQRMEHGYVVRELQYNEW